MSRPTPEAKWAWLHPVARFHPSHDFQLRYDAQVAMALRPAGPRLSPIAPQKKYKPPSPKDFYTPPLSGETFFTCSSNNQIVKMMILASNGKTSFSNEGPVSLREEGASQSLRHEGGLYFS